MSQSENETKKSTIKGANSSVPTHMTQKGDHMEIDYGDIPEEYLDPLYNTLI